MHCVASKKRNYAIFDTLPLRVVTPISIDLEREKGGMFVRFGYLP